MPNVQVRKWRLCDINSCAWGHTAHRWHSWDWNPSRPIMGLLPCITLYRSLHVPRNGLAGSESSHNQMFNTNIWTVLHEGCISLHSHEGAQVCIPKTSHTLISLTSKNESLADKWSVCASLQGLCWLFIILSWAFYLGHVPISHVGYLPFSYWFTSALCILRFLVLCLPYTWPRL